RCASAGAGRPEPGSAELNQAASLVQRGLHVREDAVQRPGNAREVERLDENRGIPLLAVPHEAVELVFERPATVRELLLVRPDRAQLALFREHALHSLRPDRPRQLIFEVAGTGVEPVTLQVVAILAPERSQEVPLLADVVEPRKPDSPVFPEDARQISV